MTKFYRVLLLWICIGVSALSVLAKKNVTVTINDANMAYIIPLEGSFYPSQWSKGKVELSLNDNTNIQVNANTGYCLQSISCNGTDLMTGSNLSYMISSSDFSDGDTIEIVGAETPKTRVIIKGRDGEFTVTDYNYMQFIPTNGEVSIDVTGNTYGSVTINATADYMLKSVRSNDSELLLKPAGYYPISVSGLKEGDNVFEIECVSREELRTSVFSVEVIGDPSLVEVIRNGYSTPVPYDSYEAISFNPDTELPITIQHAVYNKDFYSVTLNGEKVSGSGTYRFDNLVSGDHIVVETDYPDVDVPVTFHFNPADTNGVLIGLGVSNVVVPAAEVLAEGFTVKLGSAVDLKLNNKDYRVKDVYCNGVPVSSYYAWVADNPQGYVFEINSEMLPPYQVTVEGDPNTFSIISLSTGIPYELDGEISVINVKRSNGNIKFEAREGYAIIGIYDDADNECKASLMVESDRHFYVYTEEHVRDLVMVAYLDSETDWTRASVSIASNSSYARNDIICEKGYNFIKYHPEDFPFTVESYPVAAFVYLNDNRIEGSYSEYPDINKNMPDNSVLKLFASRPDFHAVTFEVADDAEFNAFRDVVTPVVDFSETLSVLPGSLFRLTPANTDGISVKVNGETLNADEDDDYSFTVSEDTVVTVEKGNRSGVASVGSDAEKVDVFNLQSVRILRQADMSQVRSLPAGIYIVGGKKVAVK